MFERIASFVQVWTPQRPCPFDCRPVKYRYERRRSGYVAVGARCTGGQWAKWNERTNRWQIFDVLDGDWDDTITRN
jgi:hypothetical protein